LAWIGVAVNSSCYITHKWQQTADTHTHTHIYIRDSRTVVVVYPIAGSPTQLLLCSKPQS